MNDGFEGLLRFWRDKLPNNPPPSVPRVTNADQAHAALDLLQRDLNHIASETRRRTNKPTSAKDSLQEAMSHMREAIQKRGMGKKPAILIREARLSRTLGLKALRVLESLGEYQGFSRGKRRSS
jgi:hypothetical protein